jgi:hypothetical protein
MGAVHVARAQDVRGAWEHVPRTSVRWGSPSADGDFPATATLHPPFYKRKWGRRHNDRPACVITCGCALCARARARVRVFVCARSGGRKSRRGLARMGRCCRPARHRHTHVRERARTPAHTPPPPPPPPTPHTTPPPPHAPHPPAPRTPLPHNSHAPPPSKPTQQLPRSAAGISGKVSVSGLRLRQAAESAVLVFGAGQRRPDRRREGGRRGGKW